MQTEKKVADLLIKQKKTISLAESCTGGMLANRLTNLPGSSKFLKVGLITYSNESKIKLLGIRRSTLNRYGAVSSKIAQAMAQGARRMHDTDFGVGITGVAGPSGGTKSKPVGLTYIAIDTKLETLCVQCLFPGDRASIKKQASSQALKFLLEFLS